MINPIRIKLEKFVSSSEQRIFKTKTAFLKDFKIKKLNNYLNFYFNDY